MIIMTGLLALFYEKVFENYGFGVAGIGCNRKNLCPSGFFVVWPPSRVQKYPLLEMSELNL